MDYYFPQTPPRFYFLVFISSNDIFFWGRGEKRSTHQTAPRQGEKQKAVRKVEGEEGLLTRDGEERTCDFENADQQEQNFPR